MGNVRLTIRNFRTDEVVRDLGVMSEHKADTVMMGALRNMNLDEYYVDEEPVEDTPIQDVL